MTFYTVAETAVLLRADAATIYRAIRTDVLADWVTARGRCLWETTFGEPPEWTGADEPDRELATQLCAGCPVRAETRKSMT